MPTLVDTAVFRASTYPEAASEESCVEQERWGGQLDLQTEPPCPPRIPTAHSVEASKLRSSARPLVIKYFQLFFVYSAVQLLHLSRDVLHLPACRKLLSRRCIYCKDEDLQDGDLSESDMELILNSGIFFQR